MFMQEPTAAPAQNESIMNDDNSTRTHIHRQFSTVGLVQAHPTLILDTQFDTQFFSTTS